MKTLSPSLRALRHSLARHGLALVVVATSMVFGMPLAHALSASCAPVLERARFEPTPPADGALILAVQNCLELAGKSPEGLDGRLGRRTWAALRAYWATLIIPAPATAAPPRDGLGVVYELTPNDLKILQGGMAFMARLKKLKDLRFPDEDAFEHAVTTALKAAGVAPDRYLPAILAYAVKTPGYALNSAAYDQLRIDGLPDDVLTALTPIKGQAFKDRLALAAAILSRVETSLAARPMPEAPASSLETKLDAAPKTEVSAPPAATPQSGTTARVETGRAMKRASAVTVYSLNDAALAALAKAPQIGADLSPLLSKIAALQSIEYPSARLFRSALRAKIDPARPDATPAEAGRPDTDETRAANSVTDATLAPIVWQARKTHGFDPDSRIVWDGGGCGCVLDSLSGVTYGFQPYWRTAPGQTVNFSVLSRIGYFALELDDQGQLEQRRHWQPDRADFINQARRHGSKVDLVVYKNDWRQWRKDMASGDDTAIDTATGNIVKAVSAKLDNSFFNRHKALFSLGASSTPSIGDGVTLYFDAYPVDAEASRYLMKFVKALRAKLRAVNPAYFLNLVVPPEAIGQGFYTFDYLAHVVPEVDKNHPDYTTQNDVDLFLVLMEEPTTQSKKALRQRIENRFTGPKLYRAIQRRNLLRKIVPVLIPDVEDTRQFDEDVIYLKDNFGGVGLWPLPVSDPAAKDPATKITSQLAQVEAEGLTRRYQGENARTPSVLSDFVCVNKWGFRITLDLLSFLLAGYGVLSIFICWLRKFWERYSWYFLALVAVWAVLALLVLFYDPYYTTLARHNGPLIGLILANLLYAAYVIINRKRQARQP